MANQDPNWDELGETIERIIDRAVNSQDYQRLNQTIRQAVNSGGEAIRRAVESASQPATRSKPVPLSKMNTHVTSPKRQAQKPASMPTLYASTTPQILRGLAYTAGGGILALLSAASLLGQGILSLLFTHASLISFGNVLLTGIIIGGGAWMRLGISKLARVGRFDKYKTVLGNKTYCEIPQLSRTVGKPAKFVVKDLNKMISDGLFLEGHLDTAEENLIVSNETFEHYRRLEEQRKMAALEDAKQQQLRNSMTPQAREVLEQGNAFLQEIHRCNDRIPGQEISEKISRMEMIVEKIFDRVKTHPEVVPALKKLMSYYLPMTVKLLNAYAEMDAQPIQGETIAASKREIEATLDTLNNAFEKLLDQVFREMAVDVSSDISVLQTLLAQEGLTEDGLT